MRARTRTLTALLPAVAVILTAGLAAAPPAAAVPAASDRGAGQLLVQYKTDTTAETKTSLERAQGLAQVKKLDRIGVEVLKTRPGNEGAAIAALQRSGRVVFAERDGRTTADAITPNDYWWPQQWSPVKVNAPQAWSVTTGSSTVVVAVLDTGVTSHPDLAGKLTAGYDFINRDSSPVDDNGHGTLAAGVVGALSNNGIGVASLCWQCKIMPVKVLDAVGSGSYSELADGIVWAADRGAKVISMSLSGVDDSSALRSAVQYARNKGAVLTSAAGNDGCDCRSFPASFPEVISVGASGTTDARASYSNYGSWVDVAAPGSNYTTTMAGAYASFSGTSSATPVVAGVLGLLRSAAPLASVGAIETALLSTASPVGYVAAGRVDAAAALGAVRFPLSGAIGAMYPSVASVLGAPTSVEYDVPGGRGQTFQAGDMLWSPSTGAREVHGPVVARYRGLGGPSSSLGLPTTHDSPAGDGVGRFNHFQGGTIIWGSATGAQDVRGAIRDRWMALGWERGALGYPVTSDARTGDGRGWYNHFQGGTIIYSGATGAQDVQGAIRNHWAALGSENGGLGYPTTGDARTGDGVGWYNHFQGGTVIYSAATGAQNVRGAIRNHWASLGSERGPLGYPATSEARTGDGVGWYNHFQGGTVIYSAASGAQNVRGSIRNRWAALGSERGPLGYPVTSDARTGDGVGWYNHFQGGTIIYSAASGTHDVRGAIRNRWGSLGSERGALGYPISDEYDVSGGKRSDFQRGSIVWDARTGATRIV